MAAEGVDVAAFHSPEKEVRANPILANFVLRQFSLLQDSKFFELVL